jgi:hypothetical protein
MKSDEIDFERAAEVRGEEVVMSLGDFRKLIAYTNRLKEAVDRLNAQIEAYDAQFAHFEEDEHEQPWLD